MSCTLQPTLRTLRTLRPLRTQVCLRYNSTSTQAEPLLPRLRTQLKSAMIAKDTPRLSVLRALLADITNASKTTSPVSTDLHLLALLRKRIAASRSAADEFKAANRPDLAEKEEAQIKVLEEYAGTVSEAAGGAISEADIRDAVSKVVEAVKGEGAKADVGTVLKRVLGEGGSLAGKLVERGEVAKIVKELLG